MYAYSTATKRIVLLASCLAIFVNPLGGSMLNLALGSIQADFHCSEHQLGWINSIYFIVSVVFVLPSAKMADIYGKKRVFLYGTVIAFTGTFLSPFAQDIYALYVFRGLTGIGMAAVSSTSVSMISDVYGPGERSLPLAINTACVYLGNSIGPAMGGIITEFIGWRFLFVLVAPFLIGAAISMSRFKFNIKSSSEKRFDGLGSAIYGIGVMALMFGIISLPETFAFIAAFAGTAILVEFVIHETRINNPLVNVSIFRNTRFSRSMIALVLNYSASYGISFFMSRYLQEVGGLTPTNAGIILMVQSVVQVVFTLLAGKIASKMDMRILPTSGMGVICCSLVMLMFVTETLDVPLLLAALVVLGVGMGLFSAPNTTAIMSYVDSKQYNAASGLIATGRQFGMMFSMGIATCLISIFLGAETVLVPENYHIFMDVLRYAWTIWFIFCAIGVVFSWFRGSSYTSQKT